MSQHTDRCLGNAAVHRGTTGWEQWRGQSGQFTNGNAFAANDFQADSDTWDYDREQYVCAICDRGFGELGDLNQHLGSGIHNTKAYRCHDCHKEFRQMSHLQQHLERNATGCRQRQARVLMRDLTTMGQQSQQLMLTNGSGNMNANLFSFEGTLHFDGGARPNPGKGGAGYVLYDENGDWLDESAVPMNGWNTTNNQAEYTGLFHGLQAAQNHGIKRLLVKGDSQLVINQMNGVYQVRSQKLYPLWSGCDGLRSRFHRIEFRHVSRGENTAADNLANQAIDNY